MIKVTKEEFETFIKNYGSNLSRRRLGFITPSPTIYCDFTLAPKLPLGIEKIYEYIVAEYVDPDPYDENSTEEYYICKEFYK